MSKSSTLKKTYFDWLLKEYHFTDLDNHTVEISTPFLDNDFDYIILYAEFLTDGRVTLSDDGWTIDNLKSHGVVLNGRTPHKNNILNTIVTNLGTRVEDNELCITTSIEKFPLAKQRLLQTIMQVNDMIVLQDKSVKNIFHDEVEQILNEREILFTRRPSFSGKEGITVQFDFAIPTRKTEKLVRTISNGNDLNRAKLLAMDTRILQNHKNNAEYIALIDDTHHRFDKLAETKAIFEENSKDKILLLPHQKFLKQKEILSNLA
ncbi:prophage protein [Streptococcus sp. DD10]|uniref:DUF1828 domain-containing protein n=1 Tax=Streptococcus sp. DD10 TaxID=1777878 RepID=UPI00079BE6D3|nr:DUF1828 domain-containing protein [Streptococcus sp. DD10]KXT73135.1 prophage protein [Streptococcus sp. DD10]